MQEVLAATATHMNKIREKFELKISEINKLPPEIQSKVFQKFYGSIQFDMGVEKQFSTIQPWVEKWIVVQVESIIQREIFAKSRKTLEYVLQENQNQMIGGFKELLSSGILEPLMQLDELLQNINDELEAVMPSNVKSQ